MLLIDCIVYCGLAYLTLPCAARSMLPIRPPGIDIKGLCVPRLKLTKAVIDGLPVAPKDTVFWDAGLPAFGVKVTPLGRKVFIVLYRVAGAGSKLRKFTIGPYGRVTLAMARVQAQKIFAARLEGRDPAAEKRESRRRIVIDQVTDLLEAYIQQRVAHLRSARIVSNRLRRE